MGTLIEILRGTLMSNLTLAIEIPFISGCAVNNAGRNVRKPTLQYTEEDYHTVMGINLESAFSLCQVGDQQLHGLNPASIILLYPTL